MRSVVAPTDMAGLARLILSTECRSIVVLTGAGVSVAASIPDFRSPGGMYETLRPELLTATSQQRRNMRDDPTHVVSWDLFEHNQFPYLEVRRPFILGTRNQQWKATIAHRFVELLHRRTNKLRRLYTQNIDGLDKQCTDLPNDKVINVHGTLSEASCEGCGHPVADYDAFCQQVETNIKDIYNTDPNADPHVHPRQSTPILCENCQLPLVKPSTVLFGRELPAEFWNHVHDDTESCDLLIVAGTSLVVAPANLLVQMVSSSCVRVIVNKEPVGMHLGIDYTGKRNPDRDCFAQGTCDEAFLALIDELGWLDDLVTKRELLPDSSREMLDQHLADKSSTAPP